MGSTNRLADAVLLAQACQVYGLRQSNEELLSLSTGQDCLESSHDASVWRAKAKHRPF